MLLKTTSSHPCGDSQRETHSLQVQIVILYPKYMISLWEYRVPTCSDFHLIKACYQIRLEESIISKIATTTSFDLLELNSMMVVLEYASHAFKMIGRRNVEKFHLCMFRRQVKSNQEFE